MLEPIVKTLEVPCDQETAFTVFVNDMGKWWPLEKRAMSLYNGQTVQELRVEAKLGGRIMEISTDGTQHHWGTFKVFDPFNYVNMDFHMGLPADKASTVEVRFEVIAANLTRVQLSQSNWEAFGDMAEMMYKGYGSSWDMILSDGYQKACTTR